MKAEDARTVFRTIDKDELQKIESAKAVVLALEKFVRTADYSDVKGLAEVLHEEYRNVQYGFFGKPGVFTIDKSGYLSLVEEKTFGGVPRSIEVISFKIFEHTSYFQVKLESEQLLFNSFIGLVRNDTNDWQVIENFPDVSLKAF